MTGEGRRLRIAQFYVHKPCSHSQQRLLLLTSRVKPDVGIATPKVDVEGESPIDMIHHHPLDRRTVVSCRVVSCCVLVPNKTKGRLLFD